MNLESYLTKIIKQSVEAAIREELEDFKEEISNAITPKSKNRHETKDSSQPESKIIRPKELANMLSISISTLYKMQDEGQLPPKIKISNNAVGWLRTDIEEWLSQRKMG
ncbi:helix-turn-helix transcriptional regulator [Fodinibius sp. SL11]|uniref:helix-turn-helix transcriptional regulator n=1 Tax=Fodinibius sp. SL11 TaxID=3425690 RepID=UPI003F88067C